MKTTLTHLPDQKQQELEKITAFVKENAEVDIIILFGSHARGDWVEDKYVEDGTTYEYRSDYDLLFVVADEVKAQRNKFAQQLKRKILKNVKPNTPVNVIYHGIDYLNAEIENGSYFFTDILKEGILLYDSEKYVLSNPKQLSAKDRLKKAQTYFDNWFESANEFLDTTFDDILKERYKKAAFELHQATERYLMTILLVFTDYKPKIHDLEELYVSVYKLDARFKQIFPRKTEHEEKMFTLLRKAYIDARYKIGYTIQKQELEYLSERVKQLQKVTEMVCKEKIEQLKSSE